MPTGHLVLIAGMALWIAALPAIAWLRGNTTPRKHLTDEVSDDFIARRISASELHAPAIDVDLPSEI